MLNLNWVWHSQRILFHTQSWFPLASIANPSCFYVFSTPCDSSFCQTNSASFGFQFHGFPFSRSFSFDRPMIPSVSLAMLSMATLDAFLSNHGAFWRSKVHTSSFPPCFLYNLWDVNAHCITSLRKSFLYHLYDFLSISKLSSCWSTRSTPPILWL